MSMPNIPDIKPVIDIDREDAFNMILASIALEEMGLAHIINAEGEKIQYVLDAEDHCPASIAEIREINSSVERVIRETTKLQMMLQEKLELVMSQLPKPPIPPDIPCPKPPGPRPRPECILIGCAEGQVSNNADFFFCGSASVEAGTCPAHQSCGPFPLKYTLRREREGCIISVLLLAVPESIRVCCPNKLRSCPTVQEPNTIIIQGQGVMSVTGTTLALEQCSVSFTLTVWDFGCEKKFQMATRSSNPEFNHDSGAVSVTSGNLEIKKCERQKIYNI